MDGERLQAGQAVGVAGEAVAVVPDPEVRPRAGRRRFTAAYKQRIVTEAGHCAPGELGALLRREGLYSSHLTKWRREFAAGAGAVDGDGKRARAAEELRMARQRLAKAERENHRLRHQLDRAETIISVQNKLSTLLQIGLPEVEP